MRWKKLDEPGLSEGAHVASGRPQTKLVALAVQHNKNSTCVCCWCDARSQLMPSTNVITNLACTTTVGIYFKHNITQQQRVRVRGG